MSMTTSKALKILKRKAGNNDMIFKKCIFTVDEKTVYAFFNSLTKKQASTHYTLTCWRDYLADGGIEAVYNKIEDNSLINSCPWL